MNGNDKFNKSIVIIVILIVLVVVAGLFGWLLGRKKSSTSVVSSSSASNLSTQSVSDVNALVSFSIPDAWKIAKRSNTPYKQYIVPVNTSLNCSQDPSAPVKIYVDSSGATDCQQLENVQNVKKHTCISLFINGHKSLKSLTEYPKSNSYSTDTTISDYLINTGKGVIRVEYTYSSDNNDYQMGFDQIASSIRVK